ncbi:MAG: acyl-CoA dehydrogenase family protein [Salinibacterium sp.]|nr:acyl-CoA dehydrogenase family protein [Salinibacterium sp.]MBF0673332.1 acyl-CoA dehydrogenase family protein [Salinibacterium sp.]
MSVYRISLDDEARALFDLTEEIAKKELIPRAAAAERDETFARDVFLTLGRAGLMSLPYPEEYGGGEQPAETYLQVFEQIGAAWASVGVGVSVHALSCFPLANYGTPEQKERWLPRMLSGELLGAYCLSEPHAGSDPAAMITRAVRDGDHYVIRGAKAWTTHGGHADFYTVMARTSDNGGKGISCFLVPADTPGLSASSPEQKMGLTGSTTATMNFDDVRIPADHLIGEEGQGLAIAFAALDSGRLGIAAVATGLGQAALDLSVEYAHSRETFGKPIIEHDGLAFLLADMDVAVASSRALYLAAARLKDVGRPFTHEASVAKLLATDNAMKVAIDAVQVLGGAGYTRDFPAERYMREAKVMQIFEGTNQIQRLVIARNLRKRV